MSTTNLRKVEGKNETEKDFEICAGRHAVRPAADCGAWLCGHEAVELADAASLRLACDHLLAGGGYLGPQQDPVRRTSRRTGRAHALEAPHEGPLGAHDPRGTREVPSRHARPLRFLWIGRRRAEGLSRGKYPFFDESDALLFLVDIRFLFAYYDKLRGCSSGRI